MSTTARTMIRRNNLPHYLGLSVTQIIYYQKRDPDFPQPVPLSVSGRAVAYFEDEVAEYQKKLVKRRAELAKQRSART